MKKCLLVLAAVALALPMNATAKGAYSATVKGEGMEGSLTFGGDRAGPKQSRELGRFADASGVYPATFGFAPPRVRAERPRGDLGPRYRVTWHLHGPNGLNAI